MSLRSSGNREGRPWITRGGESRLAGRADRPALAATQHVFDSPAPRAANTGRWMPKAPLLVPRSEMAWAAEHAGRMHLLGG